MAYHSPPSASKAANAGFAWGRSRLKFGLEILAGFEAGDFSSRQRADRPPWTRPGIRIGRSVSPKIAPDLVSYLAQQVFEGLRVASRGEPEWD